MVASQISNLIVRVQIPLSAPLEIEHIDGNALNNKEDNLILLCPNCHSLTKPIEEQTEEMAKEILSGYQEKESNK